MRWRHWRYTAPLRWRSIFRVGRVEREFDEELRFHLEMKTEDGMARGLSEQEARWEALRAMDGVEQRKEEMRDMRQINWLSDFAQDLRYAVRGLWRAPGFTAFVVVTLALGIGLNSAVFSLADAVILRPMPVPDPSGVLSVTGHTATEQMSLFSWRDYVDVRARTKTFESLVAFSSLQAFGFSTRAAEAATMRGGVLVSDNYFRGLRVEPGLGRGFQAEEFRVPGRDAVLILGHEFWKRQFGADASAIGREVWVNGIAFRVIGVAPEKFTGTDLFERPDFFVPTAMWPRLETDSKTDPLQDRSRRELFVKGRLSPGATKETAGAEMAVIAKDLERAYPETNRNRSAAVHTELQLRFQRDEDDGTLAAMLSTLAGIVLLVACANVASLLLNRARSRSREIAVRLSIGASRPRLIRLLLTESLVLAMLGGVAGLGVAFAGAQFFARYTIPTELPVNFGVRVDGRVMLVSLAATLVSALLFGLAPALQTTRTNLVTSLKTAGVDVPGKRRLWGRNGLVIAQVACSLGLLIAAAHLVRGFQAQWSSGGGYRTDHLLMMTFDPRIARFNAAQTTQFYRDVVARVRATEGVRAAGLTESIPMGMAMGNADFVPEGYQMPKGVEHFSSMASAVDEKYLEILRVPILKGRGFRTSDTAGAPPVAVVNEEFARHYWPGREAVNKRFRLDAPGQPMVEIVGVTKTTKYGWIGEAPAEFVYFPVAQQPRPQLTLLTETSGDPAAMAGPIREVVRKINANLPVYDVRTMDELYRVRAMAAPLMILQTVGAMGLVGLILAVTGLYGLVAYSVSRRTREIGIRMAIGADRGSVLRLVMRQGLVLVLIGTGFGLAIGLAAERGLGALLAEQGVDWMTLALVVPSLIVVTMAAAYLPARRASMVAPTQALRYE